MSNGVNSFFSRHEIDKYGIDGVKLWSFSEINKNIGKGTFTPNFEEEFKMLTGDMNLIWGHDT